MDTTLKYNAFALSHVVPNTRHSFVKQLNANNMPDMPFGMVEFGKPPGKAPKGLRIEKAQNGFVIYLRQPNYTEDMRIAVNMSVVAHIMQEYFTTPVNTRDHTTGTS
jgi:hypothetical protein